MRAPWLVAVLITLFATTNAHGAEIAVSAVDERGKPVADAVVVAVPADGNLRLPRVREDVVDQVNKEFLPRVQAILVGTAVSFPNRDSVRHQVYSFSPAKRFELPLYAGVPQAVVFDKAGVVVLGCNIHDWMVGYVYVSESPYFAKTNAAGKALLADLPSQAYVVRAWHPELTIAEAATKRPVDVSRTQRADVTFKLELKPEVKIRRAPVAGQRGTY